MAVHFELLTEDILHVPSDVLLLKYAQAQYGLDWVIASILIGNGLRTIKELQPEPGQFVIVDTDLPSIASRRVMILGTPGIAHLGYSELRVFARRAIEIIASKDLAIRRLSTTIHGAGFGLDASEAVQQLAAGFLDGIKEYNPAQLQVIKLVEKKERLARQVSAALETLGLVGDPRHNTVRPGLVGLVESASGGPDLPIARREHIFVAVPFSEEFQDVYEFGIYGPVRRCGYVCERVDESAFVGDILQRIKSRVESARLVIADLTGARPNVYLEVGFAWGKAVPVIFLAREGEPLHFDVKTHRCIYYKTIGQPARDLERLIHGLRFEKGGVLP